MCSSSDDDSTSRSPGSSSGGSSSGGARLSPLDCEALRMTALDNDNPEPWKAMDKYDKYC
ncbi:hypothetical protein GCM10009832_11260 [Dietzia kunjamensis subsp. schimae]